MASDEDWQRAVAAATPADAPVAGAAAHADGSVPRQRNSPVMVAVTDVDQPSGEQVIIHHAEGETEPTATAAKEETSADSHSVAGVTISVL